MGTHRIQRGLTVAVAALLLASGASPAHARAPEGCDTQAASEALAELVDEHGVTGVGMTVRDNDCRDWSVEYGQADRETGRDFDASQRFRIGSVTKAFTAALVLRLTDDGDIDLDATVADYLPGVVDRDGYDGADITVAQLLQHTSGLPDHTEALSWDDFDDWRYRTFPDRELVDMALDLPRPETEWTYSTTNYVLAGMIAESVTGKSIGALITEELIEPLEMDDTYWPGTEIRIRGPHPRGYLPAADGGEPTDVTEGSSTYGGAGGALISTLDDQSRFFESLMSGELLSKESMSRMRDTVPADPDRMWPGAGYGLGVISTPLESCRGQFWGQGGTSAGFKTLVGVTRDGRSAQIFMNDNLTTDEAQNALFTALRSALCG